MMILSKEYQASKMDIKEALELLKIEQACIRKADEGCNRKCEECFLVQPTEKLLDMYAYLIDKLNKEVNNECN
ncbi:MAG: hypothetical protein VZR53_17520 [Prevotella sp.]|nr:hypothetical protein [Prevotella sp.]